MTVALGSGLRQGELLALRWPDIDFERRTIHVNGALVRVDGAYRLAETKSELSKRTVPVGEHVIAALREEKQAQLEARLAAGRLWRQASALADLCFTTERGAPRNGSAITHAWQDALAAAINSATASAGTISGPRTGALLLQGGVEVLVISKQLGHSHMNVTARTTQYGRRRRVGT